VGLDRETDIAVLKIEATDLPYLTLGNSRELRQGQLVMAFGSPLGLQNSASLGVISAAARQIKEDSPMIYIQTDASINPGNSGGPLVDMSGRVVGLNTMILSQSGGSEGIGFAIPSDTLLNVYTQIRKEGHVHRGQIGVSVETDHTTAGRRPGTDSGLGRAGGGCDSGRTRRQIRHEAGRYRAQPGWQAHGERPPTGSEFMALSGGRQSEPGGAARRRPADHGCARYGAGRRSAALRGFGKSGEEPDPEAGHFGGRDRRKLAAMLPDLRKQYGIVVAARAAGSEGLDVDLRPGDVIYAINNEPTSTVASLTTALGQMKSGDAVVLQVERDGTVDVCGVRDGVNRRDKAA
jgi:serine protease Do